MESVLRDVAAAVGSSESARGDQPANDGQIVIIRPQVVESVGHVLGNVFQRIYHLITQAREGDATAGEQLETSTHQLEDFLQLVIDYVSPLSPTLEYVSCTEIAQSLARQISDAAGCPVKVDVKLSGDGRLLVDPGRLARGFGLLAMRLRACAGSGSGVTVSVVAKPPGRSLSVSAAIPHFLLATRNAESEIQWAVAEKFLEVHGGTLLDKSTPSGEVLWEIVLPLQP